LPVRSVDQRIGARVGQVKGVIQFAICQEAGIGGDHTAAKLEHQPALKIELSAPLLASPVGSAIAAPVNPPQNAEF